LTFNRVKSLTQDLGLINAVLSACEDLEYADGKVKRKQPIPEKDLSLARSIYAKGFPTEGGDSIIDTIIETFSKFGKVLSVRVRRGLDKQFKGSAYIEFSTEEEAKKFLDENKTLAWSPEVTLTILPKEDHVEEIREQTKQKKEKFKNQEKGGKKEKKEKGGSKKRKLEESEKEEKGEGEEGEKVKEEEKREEKKGRKRRRKRRRTERETTDQRFF